MVFLEFRDGPFGFALALESPLRRRVGKRGRVIAAMRRGVVAAWHIFSSILHGRGLLFAGVTGIMGL